MRPITAKIQAHLKDHGLVSFSRMGILKAALSPEELAVVEAARKKRGGKWFDTWLERTLLSTGLFKLDALGRLDPHQEVT